MWNRCHVSDVGNFEAAVVQRTYRGFATRTWPLNLDIEILETELLGCIACALGRNLRSEGSAFTRTAKAGAAGGSPRQRVTLTIGDGHDGVVERGVDVCHAINNSLFNFLAGSRLRTFVHAVKPIL